MIRNILFDLDNTILDFSRSEKIALCGALRRMGIQPEDSLLKRYGEINTAQWALLEQKKATRDEVKLNRFQLLFDEMGFSCSAPQTAEMYESLLKGSCFWMDGAQAMLADLSRSCALYIVTNGMADIQHTRIQAAGLERWIQKTFISEEIGFDKPDREFFARVFAQIPGFRPETALMVGDSLTSDIRGGRDAGLRTVWFNPGGKVPRPEDPLPDETISALSQLPPLLSRLSSE